MDCITGRVIFNENKVKMLGYKMDDFIDSDYTDFTDLVHPDDYDFVMDAMKKHLEGKAKLYEVEYRIKSKNGKYKWFHDRGSIVKRNSKNDPLLVKGIVYDITERKKVEIELKEAKKNLKKKVEEQTKKLEKSNIELKEEIKEKEKTEYELKQTKNYLNSIIESASELIISFDMNNRVKTWNKTSETVTGYKKIEVINRSIPKLDVFENAKDLVKINSNICNNKNTSYNDIILKTKDNEKRIVRLTGSQLKDKDKACLGIIYTGRDITKDIEIHGKLVDGNSYLITNPKNITAFNLFNSLCSLGKKCMVITRSSPAHLNINIPQKNVKKILMSQSKIKGFKTVSELENIKDEIEEFTKKNKNSLILIDGVHYLLTRFSFKSFIGIFYQVNDIIAKNNSILLLRVDPSTVDQSKMAIFENELQTMPYQKIENLIIQDDLYDMLKYIYEQNELNAAVSYKKLMRKFKIAYMTASKRIDSLEEKGLIFTKRQGKIRAVYVSSKGKGLISKRQTT